VSTEYLRPRKIIALFYIVIGKFIAAIRPIPPFVIIPDNRRWTHRAIPVPASPSHLTAGTTLFMVAAPLTLR